MQEDKVKNSLGKDSEDCRSELQQLIRDAARSTTMKNLWKKTLFRA